MQRFSWMHGISVLCLIASAHLADTCLAKQPPVIHVSAAGTRDADGSPKRPFVSLGAVAAKGVEPGTAIVIDGAAGPLSGKVSLNDLRGTAERPIVIRALGAGEAPGTIRGGLALYGASHVVLEHLAFEPDSDESRPAGACLDVQGEHVEIRDCRVTGARGDGMRLRGDQVELRGGKVAACEGYGISADGGVRVDGTRVVSCGKGGLEAGGQVHVVNSLLLHNRGPALHTRPGASLRFYHNLVYDNGGGVMLDGCAAARVINNIFVNNYATALLGADDVEIRVDGGTVTIDYNVYFRHPGKDKLLRGLPYAQGVDLSPLGRGNPFALGFRLDGQCVPSLDDERWRAKFDGHSQWLDVLQRFSGTNTYTRSYEDLFVDFQKEDFKPRYASPAVGRGLDLGDEVPKDVEGRPRNRRHPDVGPYAAPAEWWEDVDSGRAGIVDGNVPLDENGYDRGLGTPVSPFATLAKAMAFARSGSRVYVKDSIYRHTAMQTSFSLGPNSAISGFPGHRPAFSPSEFIEPARWEKVHAAGMHRIRDWHTFLGYNHRMNAWMQDFWGNSRIGGPEANVTALSRNRQELAQPFRPIRHLMLDRDTPQVLADGIALQLAGGVLGLEEFPIGTFSAWGRDLAHLRPGSFMVGRRDFLMSHAVGKGDLGEGQWLREESNASPEMNYRVDGRNVGFVSEFVSRPEVAWHVVHPYPNEDRLWKLDPSVTARFGRTETRLVKDGWRKVRADADSAWWVRQFALPVSHVKREAQGRLLGRHEARIARSSLAVHGWLQRQYQTGDPALAAVFDNPYQDYLEVRLPREENPNHSGLLVTFFNARVEAIWRKSRQEGYSVGVNQPGLAMLSRFRTMDAGTTLEATAATAGSAWDFGFLVQLGATTPELLMRMPADVDPNREDPWKLTVVDDCLYVWLPNGEDPRQHSVEAACNSVVYVSGPTGNHAGYLDWEEAGLLREDWPALKVYRTEIDFGRDHLGRLWHHTGPMAWSQGFEVDVTDRSGRTLHLLDDVRLDAGDSPGQTTEKVLLFNYLEGDPSSPGKREHRVSSKEIGPERKVLLPTKPVGFPSRYAFLIAPAGEPNRATEQRFSVTLREVRAREELRPGTYCYDAAAHRVFVCSTHGDRPEVFGFSGGRSDPIHRLRGVYVVGGNSYGHQKQYGWGTGLGVTAERIEDVYAGFNSGRPFAAAPGSVVRDCLFRWCNSEMGLGGELSGNVRHTADRIGRPELHVDHCTFDVSDSFLFDYNDSPTKNIPFANHHIWENCYFLPAMGGGMGPWWDQYCFNNVVQNCIFAGRGGVDVEVSENVIVRNNLFATDKGSFVTFRGSDGGHVLNNTTFRGGGVWFLSSPQRTNVPGQGQPTYGPSFPVTSQGPVPWLAFGRIEEGKFNLAVEWLPLSGREEVYYCENWDLPTPLLVDAKGFQDLTAVDGVVAMRRGTYYHDLQARRLVVRLADGSPPRTTPLSELRIVQTDEARRDVVYTLTVVRPGRLSLPYRFLSESELEILAPVRPDDVVEVRYDASGGREKATFPISAEMLSAGRPRLRLPRKLNGGRIFVARAGEEPPMVRVTASHGDLRPFETELIPGATIVAAPAMGLAFTVRRGHFPNLEEGDQFESVLHSRSVYHLSSVNNAFLDLRSHQASDAVDNPHHGNNYMLYSEHEDPSHSRIDCNCYWKDLHAVPGPLSASIHWGKEIVWNATAHPQGISLEEFREKTGYEAHGLAPTSYFHLVANPLRFDFRPLPDSPLLGTGAVLDTQVGDFLFDPDEGNGNQRFTYKGNALDIIGEPRGDRPSIGAYQNPLPGANAYYVASDGQDSPERGARSAPLATVAYGLARMRPGDLLVLRPGTYRHPIAINRSGTPTDFLHIVAENPPYETPQKFPHGGSSVIDATGLGGQPALLLQGCAHVRVAGLRVTGSPASAAVELRNTRDCVLEYIFVEKSKGVGIRAAGRENTLCECQVTGGACGFELAGSLTDIRWCSSHENPVGFRTTDAVAGLHLLQNRHGLCGRCGFDVSGGGSDVVLDGNWVDGVEGAPTCAFRAAGDRLMLVNNHADHTARGIDVLAGSEVRVFHNNVLRASSNGLLIGENVRSAQVLNNVLQAEESHLVVRSRAGAGPLWADYNLYTRASLPFEFRGRLGDSAVSGLAAWEQASGFDRNSRVAPLIYHKRQDMNGRWRVREWAISVSNLTPHFNVGPLGANAFPYEGGGTYILDVSRNWKPYGDPSRGVYRFDVDPVRGALAARAYWFLARIDYRRRDGTRVQKDLHRVDTPPEAMPPGSFCQDSTGLGVYVRLPSDAEDPCPIGRRRRLPPEKAVGYYVSRTAGGEAEPFRGKLVTEAVAAKLREQGAAKVEVVANVLSCALGSPTLEMGCPILGFCRDADGKRRPDVPGPLSTFGSHGGPGRFDVGAWEHGYFVP